MPRKKPTSSKTPFSARRAFIVTAIQRLRMIQFTYDGKRRLCEPHVLGRTNGKLQVLCWQESGGSRRGGIPEWRRFDVAGMENIVISSKKFDGKRIVPHPYSIWDSIILTV